MKLPVTKWILLFLAVPIAAVSIGSWQLMNWWSKVSAAPVTPETTAKVIKYQIKEGSTAQQIGRELESLGVIRSSQAWDLWSRWIAMQEPDGSYQAGTYELSTADSLEKNARKIWEGEVAQLSFTIPEGWNIRQMAAYFEDQGFFTAKEFLAAAERFDTKDFPWLPKITKGYPRLEGYLYPDTYQVAAGTLKPEDVIRQMLTQFEQVALPVYQKEKGKTNLSLAEWVTLGSIVEREAVVASERNLIAGVFTNRLKQSIPLASDPTVEYAFGITQTPDRPLTFQQVQTPHPYNTYVNAGLPPTPIASPGVESLKATLNPQKTDYLYFVAKYDGTHVFSRTMEEHLAAQDAIHDKREAEKKPESVAN
ncbi:MAG TPA: endolytic transglycosylase MltG [Leptolyngbyaceae cyanobacterium M33_DOE_097]|uniref:Endolytic murein transglycosylase n=1 Tax=Oscillatoriales cyanobacterium SpSt-418 TaxID=2282169 RepID=A0A7C3PDD9_9CYAN|nr:endolytic transglycosylase MltG [Leptolyngbyaceae cyanobacterium M33_DOE_097]